MKPEGCTVWIASELRVKHVASLPPAEREPRCHLDIREICIQIEVQVTRW